MGAGLLHRSSLHDAPPRMRLGPSAWCGKGCCRLGQGSVVRNPAEEKPLRPRAAAALGIEPADKRQCWQREGRADDVTRRCLIASKCGGDRSRV